MDSGCIIKIEELTDCDNDAAASDQQEEEVDDTPPTKKQRRKKSAIWKYFTICDDDVTKVVCSMCRRVVSRGKDLGHLTTSPMHNHIHYKHRNVAGIRSTQGSRRSQPAPALPASLSLAPLVFQDVQSDALDQPNHPISQTITESVGEMICTDLLPYSFAENKGFCKLMNVVAPQYTLPAAIHFSSKVVPQLHQRVKTKVRESLEIIEGNVVHCTADIWSRKFSASSYLSLTGHWFVQNISGGAVTHKRVSALLSMKVINTEYTPVDLLQHLRDLVEEWQTLVLCRFTVGFVVTNNTCNMVKAMSESGFEHIRCMAHSLHLIVTGAIEECHGVVSVINAARQITNTVHMSNKAIAKLHEIQEQLGLAMAALVHDVPTRWNTVLFMLQRLLEQKKALIAMATEMDLGVLEHQWTLMEAIVKVLEPFEEATHTLCQDDTSISSVIPCIQALRAALNKLIANKDVSQLLETRKLVVLLQSHLEEHFQHVFETPTNTYFKATLLDPRFKIMPMALLSKLDFERLKAAVAVEVEELLEQDSAPSSSAEAGSSSGAVLESQGTSIKSTSLFWGAMQSLTANNAASLSKTVTSSGLVETYLAESRTQSLASDPVISYWSAKMAHCPALARVAIKYLACPSTSVSSEKLLSTGGDAVAPDDRLLPVHVPQLVFTKYNLVKFQ